MNMTYFGLFSKESFQYKSSLERVIKSITLDSSILIRNCIGAIKIKGSEILIKRKELLDIEVATNASGAFIINKVTNKAVKVTDGDFFIYRDGMIIHTDFDKRFIELINTNTPSNFDILDAMEISTITLNNGFVGLNVKSESYVYRKQFNIDDINLVYKTRLTSDDNLGKVNIRELLNLI